MIADFPTHTTSNANDARRVPVLICGGGISGLSLATWLRQAGVEAVVLDKNATPGGAIGSLAQDGFLFERGPSTVLDKYHSFDELVRLAELEGDILRVPLKTQARYVWLKGQIHRVPASPWTFLNSPLLPFTAKLALLREPFIARGPEEESIADFVTRRLGPAWTRNLITPMVSGIWAGDPARLSMGQAFPIMKELERDGGLIRGAIARGKQRKAARAAGNEQGLTKRDKNMISFTHGLQQLPEALAAKLGPAYHANVQIDSIMPAAQGFTVVTHPRGDAEAVTHWQAARVIIAAEVDRAAPWVAGFDTDLAATLSSFPYNRIAVLSLGIESRTARIPQGFGFLVPRGEGLRALGAIFHSNFLVGRAPQGCTALSVFIGGELDPEGASLDDDTLMNVAREALGRAVGWNGHYRTRHIERWPRAIPQYDMQHAVRLRGIAAAEARWPGLHLAGNWRGGVAIADRVEAMRKLAAEILATNQTAVMG